MQLNQNLRCIRKDTKEFYKKTRENMRNEIVDKTIDKTI